LASASRAHAAAINEMFCTPVRGAQQESMLIGAPAEIVPLLLYPYATPERLFRYARLNGRIMETNVEPLLNVIEQPTLVVTSEQDGTVHPEGSITLARRLARATLHLQPDQTHVSVFGAPQELVALARRFVIAAESGQ
jgi:pimeloyl-ACP methyl ester carboxylesterase